MTELATLAGSVDRVAADAGILRAFGHVQPGFHDRLRALATWRAKRTVVDVDLTRVERTDLTSVRSFQCADASDVAGIEPRGQ
jgi:hypothetical protein